MPQDKNKQEIPIQGFDKWIQENKELVMRLLVGVIALAIVFLWLANLKNVWRPMRETADNESWQEIKAIINEPPSEKFQLPSLPSLEENQNGDNQNIDDEEQGDGALVEEANAEQRQLQEETDALLEELLEEANRRAIQSRTGVVCPEWVNCMPNFDGQVRPCQIPPGCEGITQVTY